MATKQDSSRTKTSYAEETSLTVLPGTPTWRGTLPNSVADFGGQLTSVARSTINESRQRQKGSPVDLDVAGSLVSDLTQNNFKRLLQSLLYANGREQFGTKPLNGTDIPLTAIDNASGQYQAASGLDAVIAGNLIFVKNCANTANNGLKTVTASASTSITVSETLVDETPSSDVELEVAGFKFASGDLDLAYANNQVTLTCTAADFTTMGLSVGQWIVVGGDAAGTYFATNDPFWGRIKSIAANSLVLDASNLLSFSNETGTGLTIQIFYGTFIRNEKDADKIVTKSVQFERQLGEDANGVQSEYLTGCVADEAKISIPTANKVEVDMKFIGCAVERRDGTTGIKSGNRVEEPKEDLYNTSSDVRLQQMYSFADSAVGYVGVAGLVGYIMESSITIKNNIVANKAVSVLGAFDLTPGEFTVEADTTVYFTDFAPIDAAYDNDNVGMFYLLAHKNKGLVIDLPLQTLGDAKPQIEINQPIKLPIKQNVVESAAGYTTGFNFLPYIPSAVGA